MKIFLGLVIAGLLVGGGWWWINRYLATGQNQFLTTGSVLVAPPQEILAPNDSDSPSDLSNESVQTSGVEVGNVDYVSQSFVQNLNVPWSLVFTSPNRILVTERAGRVRVIENGRLQPQAIRTFQVSNQSEEGLMGMALDPNYGQNKYVYLCLTTGEKEPIFDQVIRVTDKGNQLTDDQIIIDKIPAANFHAGCRLRFGPDGKLYISTGDARQKNLPQDLSSLAGKILRLNADGSIPADNPFPNSPVFSYGHRNPQGFDWHPVSQTLIATEHGPSGNDGPGGGDELNLIKAGQNYGWSVISHRQTRAGMVNPLLEWTPAIAPASGMFYSGSVFPQFKNNYFFGMLRGAGLVRVVFDAKNPEVVVSYEKLPGVEVGRVRDVVEGPDGYLYFTTSNRDGRGPATDNDDQIYRLVPK